MLERSPTPLRFKGTSLRGILGPGDSTRRSEERKDFDSHFHTLSAVSDAAVKERFTFRVCA